MKKRFHTAGKFCIPDKSFAVGKENLTPLSALTERPLGIAVVFQYQFFIPRIHIWCDVFEWSG